MLSLLVWRFPGTDFLRLRFFGGSTRCSAIISSYGSFNYSLFEDSPTLGDLRDVKGGGSLASGLFFVVHVGGGRDYNGPCRLFVSPYLLCWTLVCLSVRWSPVRVGAGDCFSLEDRVLGSKAPHPGCMEASVSSLWAVSSLWPHRSQLEGSSCSEVTPLEPPPPFADHLPHAC